MWESQWRWALMLNPCGWAITLNPTVIWRDVEPVDLLPGKKVNTDFFPCNGFSKNPFGWIWLGAQNLMFKLAKHLCKTTHPMVWTLWPCGAPCVPACAHMARMPRPSGARVQTGWHACGLGHVWAGGLARWGPCWASAGPCGLAWPIPICFFNPIHCN